MERFNHADDGAYRVETPERIDLAYDVAGLGSRFIATLVDSLLIVVLYAAVLFLGTLGLTEAVALLGRLGLDLGEYGPAVAFALIVLVVFGIFWGYYVFFELVWHGQTPGKKLAGLRVIKEGGYPLGFADSMTRNVVRIIDLMPTAYIIGMIVAFVDSRSRRLGDLAAGTIVIKERRDLRLDVIDPPTSAPALLGRTGADPTAAPIPNLSRLSPTDRGLLREYLSRQPSLAPAAAEKLAAHLADALASKLECDLKDETPHAFLVRLAHQIDRR